MFWRTKYLRCYLGSLFILLYIYIMFVAMILLEQKVQQWNNNEAISNTEHCDFCSNHGRNIKVDDDGELEIIEKQPQHDNTPRDDDLIKHIGKHFKIVTDYDYLIDDNETHINNLNEHLENNKEDHDARGRNIDSFGKVDDNDETSEVNDMKDDDISEEPPTYIEEMEPENVKYIVYLCVKPCGGWGDRMMGIFTTYTMSQIFQRQFVIAQHHPCDLTSVLSPGTVDWVWPMSLPKSYMDVLNPVGYDHSFIKYFSILDSNRDFPVNEIMNQAVSLSTLYNEQLWVFRINNAFPWAFSNNPAYTASIAAMGYNKGTFSLRNMFRDVYSTLFKLTPPLENRYNSFMKDVKNSRLVCAQIRIGQNPSMPDDVRLAPVNTTAIWQFIQSKLRTQNDRLFVTTDSEEIRKNASNEFGDAIVDTEGDITHVDRYGSNCEGMEKVALDFHILGQCDLLLVSLSNFGGLAAMLRPTRDDLYILYENNIYDTTDPETEKILCENNRDMKTKTLFCDQKYILNSL